MNRFPLAALLLVLEPQSPSEVEVARWHTLAVDGRVVLEYARIQPSDFDAARALPVLLALPPGGQDRDMVERGLELYFEALAEKHGWVVVSPAAPEGQSFSTGGETLLPALLDRLESEFRLEGGGFHLAGVSNGGRSAFRLAGLWPERFLSLTVLPGAPTSAEDEERLPRMAHLPIAFYVGAQDEDWREAAYATAEKLEALGARVELEELAGEGHVLAPRLAPRLFERWQKLRAAADRTQSTFAWTQLQFSPEVHAARRQRLGALLEAAGGGVFLTPSREGRSRGETFRQTDDFLYFTGLELPRSIFALDSASTQATVFAPARDLRFESATRPNDFPGRRLAEDPELATRSGLEVRLDSELHTALAAWVEQGRSLWIDPGSPTFTDEVAGPFALRDEARALEVYLRAEFPSARVENAYTAVAALRMVKGPEELERLRRAARITMDAMRATAREVRPGADERALVGVLEAAFRAGGAQRPAFDSIVKSGPNSLWPWRILAAHYDRRNRVLSAGELVILDVGCELDHYASDVGRTLPVSAHFTPEQAERVRRLTAISDALIAAVRPGVTLLELQRLAEASLSAEERRCMQTGSFFGHHLGLDAGDPSLLETPLAPGMVFTIEPWSYDHARGLGLFLEDMILVTAQGAENLTASLPRSPEELEAWKRRD